MPNFSEKVRAVAGQGGTYSKTVAIVNMDEVANAVLASLGGDLGNITVSQNHPDLLRRNDPAQHESVALTHGGENMRDFLNNLANNAGSGSGLPTGQAALRILGSDNANKAVWFTGNQAAALLPRAGAGIFGLGTADGSTLGYDDQGRFRVIAGSAANQVAASNVYDANFAQSQDKINTGTRASIDVLGNAVAAKASIAEVRDIVSGNMVRVQSDFAAADANFVAIGARFDGVDDDMGALRACLASVQANNAAPGLETHYIVTDGTTVDFVIHHGFGGRNIITTVYENDGNNARTHFGISTPDANTVLVSASPARPAGETYRVVIVGASAGSEGDGGVIAASRVFDFNIGKSQESLNAQVESAFPIAAQAFYIDPAGDDSIINPGNAASPFKSLRGAYNALCNRQHESIYPVYLWLNQGTYPKENLAFPSRPLSLDHTVIAATDAANPPRLETDSFIIRGNQAVYLRNLACTLTAGLEATNMARVYINEACQFTFTGTDRYLFNAKSSGMLSLGAAIGVYCGDKGQQCLFFADHGQIVLGTSFAMTLSELPSIVRSAVVDNYGSIKVEPAAVLNYPTGITGQRYQAYYYSYIRMNGNGAEYFPGDQAGSVDTATNAIVTL